jgi:DNA processing protein
MEEVCRVEGIALDDRRACWAGLNLALAEKRKLATRILARYPNPEDVFLATPADFAELGLNETQARELFRPDLLERGWKEIREAERKGFKILTLEDDDYPLMLRETFDPPLVLYCLGHPEVLKEPSLAVVGARKPSPYGRTMAENLAREAARRGLVIVSGLAFGIDTQSHWGALDSGRTVAVLGSGLDVIYPRSNRPLARRIAESGAVITEYPLGSQPLGFHFPLRNRIISGLSLAVVVVEATLRSGSLITAKLALEQNRDVMAVPGNATSELSRGANWLIQSGAKLVGRWEDVAAELPEYIKARLVRPEEDLRPSLPVLSPDEAKVWDLLTPDALTTVDGLVDATDYSVSEILSILLGLELKGAILQRPGKKFLRRI